MRTLLALLAVVAACGDGDYRDDDEALPTAERCPWPERGLLSLTRLTGNCGNVPPVVFDSWEADKAGSPECVASDVQRVTCFRSVTETCMSGPQVTVVKLWLDGSSGVWEGESETQVTQGTALLCLGHYAAQLDPR